MIGLLPFEYYTLLPREWDSLIEGYRRKQYQRSAEHRRATYISMVPFVKNLSYEKFCSSWWPLDLDDELLELKKITGPNMIDHATWEALKKQMTLPNEKDEYNAILQKHQIINPKQNG